MPTYDEEAGTITFDDCVVTVENFDPTTGVGVLIITPGGGLGSIPTFAQGLPGLPPEITIISHEVDPDDDLPGTNPAKTVVDPGGAGEASQITYDWYVHSGDKGDEGDMVILTATDLDDGGSPTAGYLVAVNADEDGVELIAPPVGGQYWPAAITSKSSNNTSPHQLAAVTVPAQPFDWRPRVFAQAIIGGSSDTRVDLVARVADAASGDQVGYAYGMAGVTPPPLILVPGVPTGSVSTYGKVAAGVSATIYLRAEQKAASSNNWSVSNSTVTYYVEVAKIP